MTKLTVAALMAGAALFVSCSHKTTSGSRGDNNVGPVAEVYPGTVIGSSPRTMPKATVFRIDPAYADKVGITLNSDGSFAYYPAPSDISERSAPVELSGGWWLNRQGLSAGSVFTDWTFSEYSALKATPSREEIKKHIIPGSGMSDFKTLPVDMSKAIADPSVCLEYLK